MYSNHFQSVSTTVECGSQNILTGTVQVPATVHSSTFQPGYKLGGPRFEPRLAFRFTSYEIVLARVYPLLPLPQTPLNHHLNPVHVDCPSSLAQAVSLSTAVNNY